MKLDGKSIMSDMRYKRERTLPNFLPFSVPSNYTIYDRGLSSFCMGIFIANCVYFNILRVVDVNELFIDVRSIGPWVI
jgi:hypothetical protein